MEFRILGPLEVVDNEGRTVPLGGARQRALLAALILRANQVVPSDRLLEEVWGEDAPQSGARLVQVYVSQLRKALGEGLIVTRAPGYLLVVDRDAVDLQRFEHLVDEARGAEPEAAAAALREALALWRGPPLVDFAYDSFAQIEIARLQELRLSALEARIEADLQLGRHRALVAELEALVAEHPQREQLCGQLMLALYRSGRQAAALEAYQAARRALTDELGIEPSQELRELQQAILRQDASIELLRGIGVEGATEAPLGVFVGRESELEQLLAGVDAAVAGRGALFLLVGEPGIGKSRLADEVLHYAQNRGGVVLVGRCWEAGGAPAFWPWVQSLRAYVEENRPETVRSQLGAGAADVAQILPELRELFPDIAVPSPDDEGARFRLFDAAARFLKHASSTRPLVLLLEDLHAADEPSLLLLRFLAGELAQSRILVIGTYRDVDPTVRDPLASTLAELARGQLSRRIELRGLAEPDVGRYLELTTGASPSTELVTAIHAETEGNPLFVGEVVRLLVAEKRLSDVDVRQMWRLGIPQGIREVIGRRLRKLSDECTRVLTLAAVLGREFGLDAVERVSELSRDEVLRVLDEALEARVLSSVPGVRGRLRFAHALIRETLYEALTTPRRVQLHRRAAEALEALYAANPEPHLTELVHHFFEAAPGGDVDKAITYARRASEHALTLLAYEEAARLCELALQALDLKEPADQALRCELLLAQGEALARAGNTPEARATFVTATALARTARLPEHLARAALGYGGRFVFARAGNDERLVPLLEEALAHLPEGDSVLRVRLLARLAGALRDQPSLEPRSSLSREAVAMARRMSTPDGLVYALASFGWATWEPDPEGVPAIAKELRALADQSGDPEHLQAAWLEYVLLMTKGEIERVATWIDEYRPLAEKLKQPHAQWFVAAWHCALALFRGDFAEAERLMEHALQLGERAQSWDAGFSHRMALFHMRREQGRLREIEELLRRSVDEYAGYRSFRCLVALLECELGRFDEARAAFDVLAVDDFSAFPRDIEWLYCLSVLSEVAAYLHDRQRAQTLYAYLLPHSHLNAVAAGEVAIGSVARYLGILATTTSRWADAEEHFRHALEMNRRMDARPWTAHTQEDYGRMLLARGEQGDEDKAAQLLDEALSTYRELRMTGPLERARASARADPGSLKASAP